MRSLPNIVKSGSVNMTDDVFRVSDISYKWRKKRPAPEAPAETGGQEGQSQPAAEQDAGYDNYYEYDEPPSAMQSEIIQSAMSEAARIVQRATEEAELRKKEILTGAQEEADQMRAEASELGRRDAFAAVVGNVKQIIGDIEHSIAVFEGDKAGFEAEYEEQLTWRALEIASKVLAKEVSRDDGIMTEMVAKAVETVKDEPWIRVEVSQEMTRLINKLSEQFEGSPNIQVSAIPAMSGTVHIETPSGVVDASLKTQLDNLRHYFEKATSY